MAAPGKTSPKEQVAQALHRVAPALRTLGPFALGTFLLVFGTFMAWQTWLLWLAHRGAESADNARLEAIAAISNEVRERQQGVQQALLDPSVQEPLKLGADGRTAAAAALRQLLPQATDAEFFSADLDEVLSGDLKAIGYAKAAALLQAKIDPKQPLAEMRTEEAGQQLMIAMPARVGERVVAFAVVELPFKPLLAAFSRTSVSGARLELRQGDGRGDLVIAGIGEHSGSSIADVGEPIPGTRLRIGKADPGYFIMFTESLPVSALLSLLCLVGGIGALWVRSVGHERARAVLQRKPKDVQPEMTLAQALKAKPEAAAAPLAKAAAPAPARAERKDEVVVVDPSIFRAYDIRGVVGDTLTTGVARMIGRAIGSEARDRGLTEIVVGRDGRLSGPDLVFALINGLRSTGIDVIDIGAAPTPVTYFACYHLRTGSGISVTGSHNPPDYNGFKIVLGGETLSEDAIQNLYRRIEEERFVDGMGGLQTLDVGDDYIRRITDDIQVERKLKVVVDCGNGIPGAIAPAVLEGIGCEVVPLYCDVDGTFPNHHPDPSDLHNLQDLIVSVKNIGADVGLAFDGDGDRLGVVTASGEVIFPDRLLMLYATDILLRNPGATIIYDVKCTGHLQPLILQQGGSPLMWRTGHSLIKAKMRETNAALAGEMSGHFFFGERWYGFDDGIYSAARLMEILAADIDGRTPEQIFATLPKGVSTPELKIPMREGEHYRFIEAFRARAKFDGARLTTIDGVRADWPDGWGLVRASNTTPVLVLRFDADSAPALRRIQDVFRSQLLALDSSLPLPF
ncbi:phosphomannomutase/phosphoglucomutase [Dokdonella fugitiva]|jgi:phosphomannomutase/phosphoglucomutase|uniref:phosphomannomutase n=1 Tax=Dokdonella fugitiva TaxID=328517 RepID=A0A4R2IH46_9GAMM|nr:phosphomannomutase/phosphoglucomutase [Dokdonella fugitiva]TCO43058.1 phosphomannomutase/phosphoglucomutase [Dokdonella fugitiva]